MVVVLVGKSGSGKDSISNYLTTYLKYNKVVNCTTRPPRINEVEGVDYYFLDDEEFEDLDKKCKFIETNKYNGWSYGFLYNEIKNTDHPMVVANPMTIHKLKEAFDCKIIYIKAQDKLRYIRQINRGDDILEIALRSERDKATFSNIEDYVDIAVENNNDSIAPCVLDILDFLAEQADQ